MMLGQRMQVEDPAVLTQEWLDFVYHMAAQPGQQQPLLKTLRGMCNLFGQHHRFVHPIVSRLASIRSLAQVMWGQKTASCPWRMPRLLPKAYRMYVCESSSSAGITSCSKELRGSIRPCWSS